jgi:hypothetical protein
LRLVPLYLRESNCVVGRVRLLLRAAATSRDRNDDADGHADENAAARAAAADNDQ